MAVSGEKLSNCLEVKPLKTLQELLKWTQSSELSSSLSAVSHLPPLPASSRNKTLVCHDMKGGYLEDRLV